MQHLTPPPIPGDDEIDRSGRASRVADGRSKFQMLHAKIQKHLTPLKEGGRSETKHAGLMHMVSELALRFQLEQEHFAEETKRLHKIIQSQRQKVKSVATQSRQMIRLRKIASKMHGELSVLRRSVAEKSAQISERDERIGRLEEESRKDKRLIDRYYNRLETLETQIEEKSALLEKAMTSNRVALESRAEAERRLAELEARRDARTNDESDLIIDDLRSRRERRFDDAEVMTNRDASGWSTRGIRERRLRQDEFEREDVSDDDNLDLRPRSGDTPDVRIAKLHARRELLNLRSSAMVRAMGGREDSESDESDAYGDNYDRMSRSRRRRRHRRRESAGTSHRTSLSRRLSEAWRSVSDLQHWALRRMGTVEAKSIAIDLGNSVIRLAKTMELYLERPMNTRTVEAALVGVYQTLRRPQKIVEDLYDTAVMWFRNLTRRWFHVTCLRQTHLVADFVDLKMRIKFVGAEIRRCKRRLQHDASKEADEARNTCEDLLREFNEIRDAAESGFGTVSDANRLKEVMNAREAQLDDALRKLSNLRVHSKSSTTADETESDAGDGSNVRTRSLSLVDGKVIEDARMGHGGSVAEADIKEIYLDTTEDGFVDMIGYDITNDGAPDYVGLLDDTNAVTKLIRVCDLDTAKADLVSVAVRRNASLSSAEKPKFRSTGASEAK
eukprot:g2047.t1